MIYRGLICLVGLCLHAQSVEECFPRDPGPLDLVRGEGTEQFLIQSLMSDALVGLTAEGRLVPRLAERWEQRGQRVRLFLRGQATFSDGAPVTAADVAWTFRAIQSDPKASPTKRGILAGVVVQEGAGWVEFHSPKPPLRLLMELARVPIARAGRVDVGSGPYAMKREGETWTFSRREHFLKPTIPTVRFRVIGDESSELNALRKGWLTLGVPGTRPGLVPPPAFREVRHDALAQAMVWSRIGPEPLKALERWRAKALPDAFLGPRARASRGLLPEGLGFQPCAVQGPPFQARGQRWEVIFPAGDGMVEKALMALRAAAAQEGITLEPRALESGLLAERLLKGDFALACATQVYDAHPWSVLELMEPTGSLNVCGWRHPRLASVLPKLTAPGVAAWKDLQSLWSEGPTALPILDLTLVTWVDKRLEVQPGPLGFHLSTPGVAGWRWR